jgi:hypothetical protein
MNGWSQRELIAAYRAYGLSHFNYSAPVLMSCSAADKAEMAHFQNRILKIIGITEDKATSAHNILPIATFISTTCRRNFVIII